MSVPIQPGWYRDPTGRDGDARWYDGSTWTDQHLARESLDDSFELTELPSETYQTSDYDQAVYTPTESQWAGGRNRNATALYDVLPPQNSFSVQYDQGPVQPSALQHSDEPKPNRKPVWWALGGIATVGLVLLLLITTGVFTAVNPDEAGRSGGVIDVPPSDSGSVHDIRVVDKASGISYKYLGEGWKDWSQGDQLEQQTTVGEYIVTQEDTPGAGQFIAQVTSGLLQENFGEAPVSEYKAMLGKVLESVRGEYYPLPNTDSPLVSEQIDLDGHKAYKYGVDLKWDVAGYDSTGERVVLILIDTGKSRPAFVYCSFPNTHAELYPLIDEVIASIKVDA